MFTNRTDAGRRLADVLDDHDIEADIVLAIPRGGLPIGRVVADELDVPLDIVSARKIGAPGNPELALGAVASDGTVWLNDSLIADLGVERSYIEDRIDHEREAASEKVERYRGDRPSLALRGKTVLIVDDGIATGATTSACVGQVKNAGAERVIVAVPVAPPGYGRATPLGSRRGDLRRDALSLRGRRTVLRVLRTGLRRAGQVVSIALPSEAAQARIVRPKIPHRRDGSVNHHPNSFVHSSSSGCFLVRAYSLPLSTSRSTTFRASRSACPAPYPSPVPTK